MKSYKLIKDRYFATLGWTNRENASDAKVAFMNDVDMSSAIRLREKYTDQKPSYTALLARAIALAIREHPKANRMVLALPFYKRIVQFDAINITIAIEQQQKDATKDTVLADTVYDVDKKSLSDIMVQLREMARATPENNPRQRQLAFIVEKLPNWLALLLISIPRWFPGMWVQHRGGSVLISSPTKYGVERLVANWGWPIGFSYGLLKKQPVVVDDEVAVRPVMSVTMSFDRRVLLGAPAARFFKRVCDLLENAEETLELDSAAAPVGEGVGGQVVTNDAA